MSLRIETATTITEPATVDEVKSELRLDSTTDDVMLAEKITAAREYGELITYRSLALKQYIQYMPCFPWPGKGLAIKAPPLVSVESIKYLDAALSLQTWDPAQYTVFNKQEPAVIIANPGFVFPATTQSAGDQAVEVHFTAGYSAGSAHPQGLPKPLKLAIMQLAAHWYDHPELVSVGRSDSEAGVPTDAFRVFRSHRFIYAP